MAVNEKNVLLRSKEITGDTNIIYPITLKDNVDGLDEALSQYADNTLNSAKSYSDTNLNSAKEYSDTTLTSAKEYSDTTLTSAKEYTDDAIATKSAIKIITWGADD